MFAIKIIKTTTDKAERILRIYYTSVKQILYIHFLSFFSVSEYIQNEKEQHQDYRIDYFLYVFHGRYCILLHNEKQRKHKR